MLYAGIDVGLTGALVIMDDTGGLLRLARFDGADFVSIICNDIKVFYQEKMSVAVEQVSARPGQDISSMFNFGVSYGKVLGSVQSLGVSPTLYRPQTWQTYLPKNDTPKGRVRLFCEAKWGLEPFIFPGCRVAHQGAMDAAALAYFHMQVSTGKLAPPKPTKVVKKRRAVRF